MCGRKEQPIRSRIKIGLQEMVQLWNAPNKSGSRSEYGDDPMQGKAKGGAHGEKHKKEAAPEKDASKKIPAKHARRM